MSDLWFIETDKIISKLIERLEVLEKRIRELEGLESENASLRERLSKYENPKNSRNSSIPPSQDENRPKKNQSLRETSDRKPGGQPGRKGNTLKMTTKPDKVIDLRPDYCRNCGFSLKEIISVRDKTRQIVDIPPVKAVWTEYRTYGRQCDCGCRTVADFPASVDSPVSYGGNIEGLIGYFHARQYLPFARMKEVMNDVFNIDISEGGIHYLLNRFANKATPLYEIIKQKVSVSKVIGTDETGVKINSDKHWFWTWQTQHLTYITHHATRGKAAIEVHFPDGFPGATLVRDGWRAQTATIAEHHQTCVPHLLRQLNYLSEKYNNPKWADTLKELLYDALELKKTGNLENIEVRRRTDIIQRLQYLLDRPPKKELKELFTFYKRILRERKNLFTFLFIEDVPSDNNASERAIRNVKVKQKISGQFKTVKAAQNFAIVRSIIDTTIKNGMNVLDALALIAKLKTKHYTD